MLHFFIFSGNYIIIAYYRDSDLAGGSFALPLDVYSYKQFSFNYGGHPRPEFFNTHTGYKPLYSVPENYTPSQFIQDNPELFL